MKDKRPAVQPAASGFTPSDIFYVLFHHKWKILFFSLAGLIAAVAYYYLTPPVYESQAKMLVRYIVDRNIVDTRDSQVDAGTRGAGEAVIQSEVGILNSWDLAEKVVQTLGPRAIFPNADNPSVTMSTKGVLDGLTVTAQRGSNVIVASYTGGNPEVAQRVLTELVRAYLEKHLEVHRSTGAFDFVSQQADQVRARLRQTDQELQQAKREAGIVSLPSTIAALDERLSTTQQDLLTAEAAVAAQEARLRQIEGYVKAQGAQPVATIDSETVSRYQALVQRIGQARQQSYALLSKYTPDSEVVKQSESEIASLESQRKTLESQYPALAFESMSGDGSGRTMDPVIERAALAGAQARVEALRAQLATVQKQATEISEASQQIEELQRRRETEEKLFQFYEESLDRARIDEALDPSKIPNISVVQTATPAFRVSGKRAKTTMMLAASGIGIGLAIAVLIEFILDKSVRRSFELEKSFGIRQMIAIRKLETKAAGGHALLVGDDTKNARASNFLPWERTRSMRAYADAIRNNLIYEFQMENLDQKPKIIGVTACHKGAGVTTLACSLAASFSETGNGRVLFVDATVPKASANPFFDGHPVEAIEDALHRKENGSEGGDAESLVIATTSGDEEHRVSRNLLDLMPKVRASDFDYIVFDLPPVNQTSPAAALSGLMDRVLLVVESEKTPRDILKRSSETLTNARAKFVGVVNKVRKVVPRWVENPA